MLWQIQYFMLSFLYVEVIENCYKMCHWCHCWDFLICSNCLYVKAIPGSLRSWPQITMLTWT